MRGDGGLNSRNSSKASKSARPLVIVVEDDAAIREALGRLFRSVDLDTASVTNPGEQI